MITTALITIYLLGYVIFQIVFLTFFSHSEETVAERIHTVCAAFVLAATWFLWIPVAIWQDYILPKTRWR